MLPPAGRDAGDQDSDIEEIPDNPEEGYEPAGELGVEEDIEDGSGNEILPLRKKKKTREQYYLKKECHI